MMDIILGSVVLMGGIGYIVPYLIKLIHEKTNVSKQHATALLSVVVGIMAVVGSSLWALIGADLRVEIVSSAIAGLHIADMFYKYSLKQKWTEEVTSM